MGPHSGQQKLLQGVTDLTLAAPTAIRSRDLLQAGFELFVTYASTVTGVPSPIASPSFRCLARNHSLLAFRRPNDLVQGDSYFGQWRPAGPISSLAESTVDEQRRWCFEHSVIVKQRFIGTPQHANLPQAMLLRELLG